MILIEIWRSYFIYEQGVGVESLCRGGAPALLFKIHLGLLDQDERLGTGPLMANEPLEPLCEIQDSLDSFYSLEVSVSCPSTCR
jgi:hypothetical protein